MQFSNNFRKHDTRVTTAAGMVATALLTLAAPMAAGAQVDVTTWHNDNARTGQNLSESMLTPARVNATNFGVLFSVPVDGKVDAQPLYVSAVAIPGKSVQNVVVAVTEHDSVYAINADTGAVLWKVTVLGSGETTSDSRGCNQVTPEIGATATPVIDRSLGAHGTIFLTAMSKDGSGNYFQRLHALDLATGAEQANSPVNIVASYPGNGDNSVNGRVVFDAKQYKDRPGLLLLNGTVYTSWGSHCDARPYTGWIIGYKETTLAQNGVFDAAPNGSDAAPWNAGSGPAADLNGNIFVSLGNGTFDTSYTAQGFPSLGDYGNSVVKLTPGNGTLPATDFWTMFDTIPESDRDIDLGSGGLLLLPDAVDGTGKTRHLLVAAGKDSNLYVADRDNLGKYTAGSNSSLYQEIPSILPGGQWSSPAYFNNRVYFGPVGNALRAFDIHAARLSAQPTSLTSNTFAYPGVTPSVSGYGNTNGIVWAINNSGPAVLHAYDANNLAKEFYNSTQAANSRDNFGNGNKFIAPTIANGKVYIGTPNSVAVFGYVRQTPAPIADGDYNVVNGTSRMLLDDGYASLLSGNPMIQWPANGGNNQKWFFSYQGNGYYLIQNVFSRLFLADPGGSTTPYTTLEQQTPTNDDSELWALVPNGSGYLLQNKASGLVADDPRASTAALTGIILWTRNNGTNQTWSIQPAQ